ncbi:MAG: hypothetical protein ACRYFL_00050 [Janthinobacterium lividum]
MSIFNLNANKAEKYIQEVGKYPDQDLDDFIVNPFLCLDAIFTYFKYGILKKEILQTITHLCYNDYQLRKMHLTDYHYNEIILKLALITLCFNNNPLKELKFINTIFKYFKTIQVKENSSLNIFYTGFQANAYWRIGNIKKALSTQNQFLKIQDAAYNSYTPFMKVFFSMLSVKASLHNQAYKVALLQAKTLNAYCNKTGYLLSGIYTSIFFLDSINIENTDAADVKEIYNYILRNIRSSGFRLESFLQPDFQNKIDSLIRERNRVA